MARPRFLGISFPTTRRDLGRCQLAVSGATLSWEIQIEMGKVSVAEREHAGNAVSALTEYSELLFDRAPVMMHSVNKGGKLVKVNRIWTERLGHKRKQVVGHSPTEFLTGESRARAIQDVLPLFWRNGSDRSVGMRFVKQDGRILDVQLDAEVVTTPGKTVLGYAALRDPDDRVQWGAGIRHDQGAQTANQSAAQV